MLIAIYLIIGVLSFSILVMVAIVFGKLMLYQLKRWILKSKGYIEVEHVSETGIRNYYLLKPENFRFQIGTGYYHYIPETLTKTGEILKVHGGVKVKNINLPKPEELSLMSPERQKAYVDAYNVEKDELLEMGNVISKLKFHQRALTTRWGMPVITYYGDRPDPIVFSDTKKMYGAGVIRDMFLRLLLTQRYKDYQRMILIGMAVAGGFAIAFLLGFLLFNNMSGHAAELAAQNAALAAENFQCNEFLTSYLNQTKDVIMQDKVINI